MTGEGGLWIAGLGPGPAHWMTPEAAAAIAQASDIVGYAPYLDRLSLRDDQRRHPSGNRVEIDRARLALGLAAEGRKVALVSGGDPGIFAMAAAVFEALEAGEPAWRALAIEVAPGLSAMQAAAARLGAPLGHDFCAISLSDNLKSWDVLARRLGAAADGDFVIALYNPASQARPTRIFEAFDLLRQRKSAATPVAFARAVGRADERIVLTDLGEADPGLADMSTLVFIGSSETRFVVARRGAPVAADAALLRGRAMSLDPCQNLLEPRRLRGGRPSGSLNHHDRDAEDAGRFDLGVGRLAAAILGDHDVDVFGAHQRLFVGEAERSARQDQPMERQRVDVGGRFDRAHEIAMLRRAREGGELRTSLRQEHPAGLGTQRLRRRHHRPDLDPAVAALPRPRRAGEDEPRDARRLARLSRVARHARGERVGGVDHRVDPFGLEIVAQSRRPAEPADAPGNWRGRGIAGAPGQREDRRHVGAPGERGGQRAGLRRAAENEKAHRFLPQGVVR